jgi:hypothetical protein
MNTFESTGNLTVPLAALEKARQDFSSFSSDKSAILQVGATAVFPTSHLPYLIFIFGGAHSLLN